MNRFLNKKERECYHTKDVVLQEGEIERRRFLIVQLVCAVELQEGSADSLIPASHSCKQTRTSPEGEKDDRWINIHTDRR